MRDSTGIVKTSHAAGPEGVGVVGGSVGAVSGVDGADVGDGGSDVGVDVVGEGVACSPHPATSPSNRMKDNRTALRTETSST
jgi:hypothetical protein